MRPIGSARTDSHMDKGYYIGDQDPVSVMKLKKYLWLKTNPNLCKDREVGPLAIYKMELTYVPKDRRWEFGTTNPQKSNKVIMIVGEAGSGKATLINAIINYMFGMEWKDDCRIQLMIENSWAPSQRSAVTAYKIHHEDHFCIPYSLTIIDTPGFGGTKDNKAEKKIVQKIKEVFSNSELNYIDAICFVAQTSTAHLILTENYVFQSIVSLFGKNVEENIMFIDTFADTQNPPALAAMAEDAQNPPALAAMAEDAQNPPALAAMAEDAQNPPALAAMAEDAQNPPALAAMAEDAQNPPALAAMAEEKVPGAGESGGCPIQFNSYFLYGNNCPDNEDGGACIANERLWSRGMENIGALFTSFSAQKSRNLILAKDVLKNQSALDVTLEGLTHKIEEVMTRQNELEQTEQILLRHRADIEINQRFQLQVTQTVKRNIRTMESSTNCCKCQSTCHHDCLVPFSTLVYWCEVFTLDGVCRVCGHGHRHHSSENSLWQTTVENREITYVELKARYTNRDNEEMTLTDVLDKVREEIGTVKEEALQLIHKATEIYRELQESPSMSATDFIQLLIVTARQEGNSGFQERIEMLEKAKMKIETS